MLWSQSSDSTTEKALTKTLSTGQKPVEQTGDPALAASIARVQQQAGWLSPDTKLVLAKSGASDAAIQKAAELGARRLVDRNDPAGKDDESFWSRNIYPKIKAASRWAQAGLDFVPEFAQGAVAQLFDDNKDVDGWFISTKLGTMIEDSDKAGEGFFVGGEAAKLQAERARRYRGTVNGSAWTLGRQAANMLFLPNSKPYNLMSGVIDAAVLIGADPTTPVTKAFGAARATRMAVPLQGADEAAELAAALRAEAGLSGTDALDSSKWLRFMNNNKRARVLVDRIWSNSVKNVEQLDEATEAARAEQLLEITGRLDEANKRVDAVKELYKGEKVVSDEARSAIDEAVRQLNDVDAEYRAVLGTVNRSEEQVRADKLDSLLDIFTDSKTGKLRVDTDVINELLEAGSRNEVLAVLSPQWVVKSGSLPEDIRRMQGMLDGRWVDRVPLTAIRKSKLFTQMPGSKLIVSGSDLDNREALTTFRNWARTVGMSRETEQRLVGAALKAFSRQGGRADQFETVNLFFDSLGEVLRLNGVSAEFTKALQDDSKRFADLLRLYFVDQGGKPFDGGFFTWLRNSGLEENPERVKKLLDETFDADAKPVMDSPSTMVEMLNRTVYLPDVREIRRLTRSRLMRETINKAGKEWGRISAGVTTKATRTPVQRFANQSTIDEAAEALKELGDETRALLDEQKRMPEGSVERADLSRRITELNAESEGLTQRIEELKQSGYVDDEIAVRRGQLRAPLAALEWYQQSLWKPLALMTGGYIVRNTLDAQIRMALSGFSSIINHPFKYIALVTGRTANGDVLGNSLLPRLITPDGQVPKTGLSGIVQKIRYGKFEYTELAQELQEELSFGLRNQGFEALGVERLQNTNQWVAVPLQQNRTAWFRGFGQNLHLVNTDAMMRIAAGVLADGGSREDAIDAVFTYLKSDDGAKMLQNYRKLFQSGVNATDEFGNRFLWVMRNWDEADPDDIDDLLKEISKRLIVNRVQMLSGGDADMLFMFRYNAVPLQRKGVTVAAERVDVSMLQGQKVGDAVQLGESDYAIITKIDKDSAVVQRVVSRETGHIPAVQNRNLTYASRGRVEKKVNDGFVAFEEGQVGLPGTLKYEELQEDITDQGTLAGIKKGFDGVTDWFFGRLYAGVTTKLDRSPVFRQAYYRAVDAQLGRLTPQEAVKLVDSIKEGAAKIDYTPERYIGDKALWKRIVAKSKEAPYEDVAAVTIQDLDDYAKWVALDEVKGLLYNAAARNNLEDALRIVAPFAVAWREILGTYADFAMSNPINTYRQFQRVYTGLEGADPENDGRGFIYADPVTKQTMFSFPMSGLVARAFAGTPGFLEAPVGQLSAGMSVIPALGPYGQIAVSQLPDNPSYDDIINFLLPYGRTENGGILFNITPGWINKANQALRADTRDHATMFYNTYIDTVRAKAASGNYDLSNMADKERLLADSEKAARVLMMMRAASQFFGPTSASVEFQVPTSQGDQYVSALSQEFYKMQAEDYDTAIQRFLETFGDDAFVYVASKTRSLRDGLEATEEFGDWERRNQPLLAEYPDVAAYLAPAGSDFNFAVWQRQLLSGEREKLSDREVLLLAQERVGAAKYRAMRLQAGQYPTDEVRDWLRQYRQQLSKQYPGFPEVARFEVGKFPAQMQQLEAMVADPRAEGNVVAGALQKYLGVRNELIARARAAGYVANDLKQTKALQAFRDYLASYGNALILETPEFGRIYDRLLAQEVEF